MQPTNVSPQTELYQARLQVESLRRAAFERPLSEVADQELAGLAEAENRLAVLETSAAAAARAAEPRRGLLAEVGLKGKPSLTLGQQTTGLTAQVFLRMEQLPTSICHLFDPDSHPLVSCTVSNFSGQIRRLRVTTFIEGYSAQAIQTVEIDPSKSFTFNQLPTLFPERLRALDELTRATLNVLVEDLDSQKVESHSTHPIWLLAREAVPLAVKDPQDASLKDISSYLGAFVTPNSQPVLDFLRQVVDYRLDTKPNARLDGYQSDEAGVEAQVQAAFQALKEKAAIKYIHCPLAFNPEQGVTTQRVRLPRESLAAQSANCIDGTVLFASLLEGIAINPALVLVPGHAFLAWAASSDDPPKAWKYLETTLVSSKSFSEARTTGEFLAAQYNKQGLVKRWPLNELRTKLGIYPME